MRFSFVFTPHQQFWMVNKTIVQGLLCRLSWFAWSMQHFDKAQLVLSTISSQQAIKKANKEENMKIETVQ